MAFYRPQPRSFPSQSQFDASYQGAGNITGFELTITGSKTFTVSAGYARAVNTDSDVNYTLVGVGRPSNILGDIDVLGAGGVFPNTIASLGLASDTVFPLYALSDDSGKNVTTVVVATGNEFMLPGYNAFRRIGLIWIDSTTGNIIPMLQSGAGDERKYAFSPIEVLPAGSATAATLINLSAGDNPIVPGVASSVDLVVFYVSGTAGTSANITPTGLTGSFYTFLAETASAEASWPGIEIIPGIDSVTGDAGIDYFVTTGSSTARILLNGFTDNLRLNVL